MIITINTDASYFKEQGVAAYAFWITSDKGRIKRSGVFKTLPINSQEAEFKAILNALFYLQKFGYTDIDKIIINTDCLTVISTISAKKVEYGWRRDAFKIYQNYIAELKATGKIELRHVKAHKSTKTARSWVNNWADKEAKAQAKNKINEMKNK